VFYLLALLIGIFSGFRTLTPITAVSWAARAGRLHLEGTWLSFLGAAISPYIFSVLALTELVTDKLPKTPSRKSPPQFISRVVMGAVAGAAIGASNQNLIAGLLLGAVGAVIGTLGGAEVRGRLARAFGRDLPAALIEDAVTIIGAFLVAFQNS
jgi:uncharacterized membrane protein